MNIWDRIDLINKIVEDYHYNLNKDITPWIYESKFRWFYLVKTNLCLFFNFQLKDNKNIQESRITFIYNCESYQYEYEYWCDFIHVGLGLNNWWYFVNSDPL